MSQPDLSVTWTSAGLGLAASKEAQGLSLRITRIGVGQGVAAAGGGRAGYAPARGQTALVSEFDRQPIGQAEELAANEVSLAALFEAGPTAPEGWIYEVGFYAEDGTLCAVWSEAGNRPLAYRSALSTFILSLVVILDEMPADLVQFVVGGPSLQILNIYSAVATANAQMRIINELTSTKVADHSAAIGKIWG